MCTATCAIRMLLSRWPRVRGYMEPKGLEAGGGGGDRRCRAPRDGTRRLDVNAVQNLPTSNRCICWSVRDVLCPAIKCLLACMRRPEPTASPEGLSEKFLDSCTFKSV